MNRWATLHLHLQIGKGLFQIKIENCVYQEKVEAIKRWLALLSPVKRADINLVNHVLYLSKMDKANTLWPLSADNFDRAACTFNAVKPVNSKIAGIALVYKNSEYLWSVNYEVYFDGPLPAPNIENIPLAHSVLEKEAPNGAVVRAVDVCNVKPGGLLHTKWQVSYSVEFDGK